jgi:glutamine synthetase
MPRGVALTPDELEKSALMRDALGDHIFDQLVAAKRS